MELQSEIFFYQRQHDRVHKTRDETQVVHGTPVDSRRDELRVENEASKVLGRVTSSTMSLIKKGRRSCRALARALARVWKFLLRHLTRQGELERALRRALADERGGHSPALVKAIASSLARSSQLAEVKAAVFGKRAFSASVASAKIRAEKGIRDEKVGATLTWSLQVSAIKSV